MQSTSEISFKKDITIIVGQNNAGKSTIVEALRLVALAGRKSKTMLKYEKIPASFNTKDSPMGLVLKIEPLKIDLRTIVYFYKAERTASIEAQYSNGERIVIFLNSETVFACFYNGDGLPVTSKSQAIKCNFDSIGILPQIGLIKENEIKLTAETTLADRDTYLSSRHFRNEVLLYKEEYFDDFKQLAERTWSGLKIEGIEYNPWESDTIDLYIQDAGFPAEIGLMGSGIQMWLQITWFICRSREATTIILDEPDVYMHPDLQTKILNILKQRFKQVILATHSVEIISSFEPYNIVAVDKKSRKMKYADSTQSMQKIIDDIGGVHNLSLLRISNKKKCVFTEGHDIKLLSKLQRIISPDLDEYVDSLPCISLGGFSRLKEAFGAAKLFFAETQGDIKTYCFVDHDYYPKEYLDEQIRVAKQNNLYLHIWNKKEIENYILVPKAIFRLTKKPSDEYPVFLQKYADLIDKYKMDVQIRTAAKRKECDKTGKDFVACQKEAADFVNAAWDDIEQRIALVNGKELLSDVNSWMREKYGVSCSLNAILRKMKPEDIDQEVKDLLAWLTGESKD